MCLRLHDLINHLRMELHGLSFQERIESWHWFKVSALIPTTPWFCLKIKISFVHFHDFFHVLIFSVAFNGTKMRKNFAYSLHSRHIKETRWRGERERREKREKEKERPLPNLETFSSANEDLRELNFAARCKNGPDALSLCTYVRTHDWIGTSA